MDILANLKQRGVTCILISHRLEELFRITDNITVMRDGGVVGTVETKNATSAQLIAMMVGREMSERFPPRNPRPGEVVLDVKNLSVENPTGSRVRALRDISFQLHKGEIIGVAGLMGSGRSEMVRALFGEYGDTLEGEIILNGQPVRIMSARQAMNHKIGLVPEDRKQMGLVLGQSILKNMSLPNLERFAGRFSINSHAELRGCSSFVDSLGIKTPSVLALVNSLSGGNQQKVVIAKWLMSEPIILILDEPTRGIDVGAKYEIYKVMNRLADEGVAIILVSSELPEVLGMSDRILVMHEGQSAGILNCKTATQEKIMTMATGLTGGAAAEVL